MKKTITVKCILFLFSLTACIRTHDFESLTQDCKDVAVVTTSIDQIKSLATNQPERYVHDDLIEAYVVSNDQSGNFFKKLILQNREGTLGFSINLDHTDLYTRYNPGRKIYFRLKDSYFQIKNEALELGALFTDPFNRESVGRIAYPEFEKSISTSCDQLEEQVLVKVRQINSLADNDINTLIEIQEVQFTSDALSSAFYNEALDDGSFGTNHFLEDRNGNRLILRTSFFADFANSSVPVGSGRIRGILTKFKGSYLLTARTRADIKFSDERFEIELKNNLFFTELADPDNNNRARFIEIYNAEASDVNLNGWSIRRYTNENTEVSSILNLEGSTIQSQKTFVIAANALEFEQVYGFKPGLEAGTNGPADSNGDDNLVLVDSQGEVVDVFGIIGEDGSGTNHEFEDGRAFRKLSISLANPNFTSSEWIIWNDTGLNGTINLPQIAPENFTPGAR